jgi:hypothetical protein
VFTILAWLVKGTYHGGFPGAPAQATSRHVTFTVPTSCASLTASSPSTGPTPRFGHLKPIVAVGSLRDTIAT